ncbi:MAG: hypothetical protein ACHQ50_04195 [Fimbriimonadales bacterium]
MLQDYWILVVEPRESDRKLIELAALGVAPGVELVFVTGYDEFVSAMAARGSIPTLAVIEWFAGGGGPESCLDTLGRLGFLPRLPLVATARDEPMRALNESFDLGIPRFVSKRPDDFCFRKKIAEAISECIPGAKKVMPPSSVH